MTYFFNVGQQHSASRVTKMRKTALKRRQDDGDVDDGGEFAFYYSSFQSVQEPLLMISILDEDEQHNTALKPPKTKKRTANKKGKTG